MPSLEDYQTHSRADDLTIVSVSFNTAPLLRLNRDLVAALNRGRRYWWIVVENTPTTSPPSQRINAHEDGFIILPGTRLTAEERGSIGYGSIHHAKSLSIALAYVQTDKVLVLDPDCYLLPRGWIERLIKHIDDQGLVFWGTPYHPERLNRFNYFGRTYTNFPTAICMLINRKLFQQLGYFVLDFTPPIQGTFNTQAYQAKVAQLGVGLWSAIKRLVSSPIGLARWGAQNVRLLKECGLRVIVDAPRVGGAPWMLDPRPDIGHQIYKRYHRTCKSECCSIYYERKFPPLFNLWKWLVPQSLLGYPKVSGTWKHEKFPFVPKEFVRQGRWEQFYFGEEPFALHIGKVSYDDAEESEFIYKLLCPIIHSSEERSHAEA